MEQEIRNVTTHEPFDSTSADEENPPVTAIRPRRASITPQIITRTRYIKLINTITFLVMSIVVIIAGSNKKTSGYHIVAYLISIIYIIGAIYFLLIILTSTNLHYIYVERQAIDGFQNFVVPKCIIQETNRTIKSVSAVTATFGSNAHGLFSRSAHATAGVVFASIVIHGNENDGLKSHEVTASVLMLIGIFGNAIYGTWELEGVNNYIATTMHYSSAPLIFILQTLAYCIQQQWNVLSSVLLSVGIVLDIFYVIVLYRLPETSEDVKRVHFISLTCILAEFTALIIPCLSVVLFVYSL